MGIIGSNAGYTMFRGSVKSTGYPLHSPVSRSLPLTCVTVCHHVSSDSTELSHRPWKLFFRRPVLAPILLQPQCDSFRTSHKYSIVTPQCHCLQFINTQPSQYFLHFNASLLSECRRQSQLSSHRQGIVTNETQRCLHLSSPNSTVLYTPET